jgi:hypothetical protein
MAVWYDRLRGVFVAISGALVGDRRVATLNIIPGTGLEVSSDFDERTGAVDLTIAASGTTFDNEFSASDRLLGRDTAGAGAAEEIAVGGGLEFTGSQAIQRSALTGAITAAAGSNVTALGNNVVTLDNLDSEVTDAIAAGGAPTTAEYLVGASNGSLSAERVVTNTTTVAWDLATPGQASANVPDASLTRAKLANGIACSVIGRVSNSTGQVQDIQGNTNDRVLARSSDVVGFVQVTRGMIQSGEVISTHIEADAVTNAALRNSGACSVIGRAANSSGDPADISAATNDRVFCRTGDTLQFTQVTGAMIAPNTVALSNLAQVGTDSLLGRDTAGTGNVESIGLDASLQMSGLQILQRAALTGDVTAAAGSNATTIPNNTVTNAKASDMAEATIKGRASGAGTGDPTDLTSVQAADVVMPTMEFDFNVPGLTDGDSADVTLDVTGLGLQPGDNVFVSPRPETSSWPVRAFVGAPRCQVADALIVPIAAIGGAVSSATCAMVVTRRPR